SLPRLLRQHPNVKQGGKRSSLNRRNRCGRRYARKGQRARQLKFKCKHALDEMGVGKDGAHFCSSKQGVEQSRCSGSRQSRYLLGSQATASGACKTSPSKKRVNSAVNLIARRIQSCDLYLANFSWRGFAHKQRRQKNQNGAGRGDP